jgi:thymidylate synthase
MFKNFGNAFVAELYELMFDGKEINVRNNDTKEIVACLLNIENPLERIICLPGRNNNIFATVAETLWVLAGRNDIAFLERYLPRAEQFSDDGKTWRAGYGKRLRHYHDVDQMAKVCEILGENRSSRQAVISMFDPTLDYAKSKDIPCTNWLHFMVRDGKLHLSVVIRSNDIMWGASAINWFEWSVLQQLVANTLDVNVGTMSYFADSLHIYSRHFEKARKILELHTSFKDMYECGAVPSNLSASLMFMDNYLDKMFVYESWLRSDTFVNRDDIYQGIMKTFEFDSFMKNCAQVLAIDTAVKLENDVATVYLVNEMYNWEGSCDLRFAVLENLCRKKELPSGIRLHENERKFLRQFKDTNCVETLA